MIQLVPRVRTFISYGDPSTYWAVNGGWNQLSDTWGPAIARIPLPWAATARNLVIYSRDTIPQPLTVTLMKNGVATALSGTLPALTVGPVVVSGIDVSYTALDDWSYRFTTPLAAAHPGYIAGVCLDVENVGNVFGMAPSPGGVLVNAGRYGGGLGNGIPQLFNITTPSPISNSRSICASPGVITTLCLKAFNGPVPVGSSWIGLIFKNQVAQDGSGGTVDTRCVMTAGNTEALTTGFSLPIVKGDHIDIAFYRTGAAAPFTFVNVAMGLGFLPDNADYFMLTGGSNAPLGGPTGYVWPLTADNETTEALALVPIGPSGLIARGLYVERIQAPGLGDSLPHTVRKDEADTVIEVTLVDAEKTGLIENQFVDYPNGSVMTLQVENDTGGNSLYWGLEATIEGVGPPAGTGTLIVIKEVIGSADTTTLFTIEVGGGLSPATIQLADGDSQTYAGVTPGSGYSVAEPSPPTDWTLVSITVSNGSPADNISIAEGETVTVTVTNQPSGTACPGERLDPRIDGLPYVPPVLPPCEGTGTLSGTRIGT